MSATITYNNTTLTTVENEKKKLNTAGTWLQDDITVEDVSSSGGAAIIKDTIDEHGGTIREIITENELYIQQRYATPSQSAQNIEPTTGYNALSNVRISAIPSTYVGSGINIKSSNDLTVSGSTVTAPAGYYANAATYAFDFIDGNNLEYGIIDDDSSLIGVGLIDYMEVE